MYKWWHSKVWEVVWNLIPAQNEASNQHPEIVEEPQIHFHKESECPAKKKKQQTIHNIKLYNEVTD